MWNLKLKTNDCIQQLNRGELQMKINVCLESEGWVCISDSRFQCPHRTESKGYGLRAKCEAAAGLCP